MYGRARSERKIPSEKMNAVTRRSLSSTLKTKRRSRKKARRFLFGTVVTRCYGTPLLIGRRHSSGRPSVRAARRQSSSTATTRYLVVHTRGRLNSFTYFLNFRKNRLYKRR